jgi:hypothetical protein
VCRGDEDGIIDCMFDQNHNCDHENDVAVRCMTTDTGWGTIHCRGVASVGLRGLEPSPPPLPQAKWAGLGPLSNINLFIPSLGLTS